MERALLGPTTGILQFGPYELRPRVRGLYKHGRKIRLRPQPFQVLQILLEYSGEVVTRDELHNRLWSSDTFVDFEHGLNTAIKELRGALGDSAAEPRYIETLPRVGYRFIVPVNIAATTTVPRVDAPTDATKISSPPELVPATGRSRQGPILVGIFIFLIAALAVYLGSSRIHAPPRPAAGRFMLAVLPFENLTGDSAQEYFSDGLTEEMIAQLGRVAPQQFGVIARTSVMHYKHTQEQLGQIGRELGVQYVLEGSVRRDPDKVRISAQLIQVKDQANLWARQYDRELRSLLTLQGEIAQEIADEIEITLGAHKPVAPVGQPVLSPQAFEAYDLYLKGQYFWNKRTIQGFRQAIEYFQQATAKDPQSARAYAGLADCYTLLGGYSMVPQAEFMLKARAAALKALQIDEALAEAHTALALIVQNYDWDWQTSEKEFRRAIELNPNYATAHHWYAEHLTWLGRFDEAFRESERARQLDPLSLIIAADHSAILYFSRQYDLAIEQFRTLREMEPDFPRRSILLNAYVEKGLFADALAEIERERRALGGGAWIWAELAYVYGRSGQPVQARHAREKLEELNRRQEIDAGVFVGANLAAGNKDQAFVWLEKAYSQHSNLLMTLRVDPMYDDLRGDPRFQSLLRRVGLGQ